MKNFMRVMILIVRRFPNLFPVTVFLPIFLFIVGTKIKIIVVLMVIRLRRFMLKKLTFLKTLLFLKTRNGGRFLLLVLIVSGRDSQNLRVHFTMKRRKMVNGRLVLNPLFLIFMSVIPPAGKFRRKLMVPNISLFFVRQKLFCFRL